MTVVERFRKAYEANDWEALVACYAPDALLDSNVPQWRFQKQGRADIAGQYETWFGDATVKLTGWLARDADWGSVVETEHVATTGQGDEYVRQMHVLIVRDDLITEHVFYCTGEWDTATVDRQRREAPMIRP